MSPGRPLMPALVYVEHHEGEPVKGSLGVLARAAKVFGGDVTAVLCGAGVRSLADGLGPATAPSAYSWPTTLLSSRRSRNRASMCSPR